MQYVKFWFPKMSWTAHATSIKRMPRGKRWAYRCRGKTATCLAKFQQFLHDDTNPSTKTMSMARTHFAWEQQGVTVLIPSIIHRLHRGRSLQTETFFATRPCPGRNACSSLTKFLLLLHVTPLATKKLQNRSGHYRLWMFIFGDCFDLSLAPPSQTTWLNPWNEILYDGNARVAWYV